MIKDLLNRRFACKHFDTTKTIDKADLEDLLDSTRLTPTAYGLQAWKFIVIQNKELQEKMAPLCWNQAQITEAPTVVVLCADTDVLGPNQILDQYGEQVKANQGRTEEQVNGYKQYIRETLEKRSPEEIKIWLQHQVYLAGMTMMLAATEKGIDSCPMEGFSAPDVKTCLELPENLHPTLIIPLGYKNMDVTPKARFQTKEIVQYR